MIEGIGTDIADIARFQRFLDEGNQALLKRLFTSRELDYCMARKTCSASLAGRFAAKEACLKALGTGLSNGISWHDLEIVNNAQGRPEMVLTGTAAELAASRGISSVHLSISHDGGNAIAMVVLEKA